MFELCELRWLTHCSNSQNAMKMKRNYIFAKVALVAVYLFSAIANGEVPSPYNATSGQGRKQTASGMSFTSLGRLSLALGADASTVTRSEQRRLIIRVEAKCRQVSLR